MLFTMYILLFCLIAGAGSAAVVAPDSSILRRLREKGFLTSYVNDNSINDDVIDVGERSHDFDYDNVLASRRSTVMLPVIFDRNLIHRQLKDSRTVVNYLDSFGYIDAYLGYDYYDAVDSSSDEIGSVILMEMADIEGSLKLFQTLNNLPVTGVVDADVLGLMGIPRCGNPDNYPNHFSKDNLQDSGYDMRSAKLETAFEARQRRKGSWGFVDDKEGDDVVVTHNKRFQTSDDKWRTTRLAFYIDNESVTLTSMTKVEILRAFEVWIRHVKIHLYEVTNKDLAHIRISFVSRNHGDKYPFDGPLGVLAHAFYPPSGEVHFDNQEKFTYNSLYGVNLYYTAAHEFGHTLGLKHSANRDSLMSPYHRGLQSIIELAADDMGGIKELYPSGQGGVYTSDHPKAIDFQKYLSIKASSSQDALPKARTSSCVDRFDAVIQHPKKRTLYFFSGDVFYKVERNKHGEITVADGYPKSISAAWGGLATDIDAAFVNISICTGYFFKGSQYWKYDFLKEVMYVGYPKEVNTTKIPAGLKSTISSGHITYFFTSSNVWKYDQTVDIVERLKNVKMNLIDIDSAFPLFVNGYFGVTYGKKYSIYKVKNMQAMRVYTGRPLAWDYGVPMCSERFETASLKTKEICEAYKLLAMDTMEILIPENCYSIMKPFPVKMLEDIIE